MRYSLTATLVLLLSVPLVQAADTLVTRKSPHSVSVTADRFAAALKEKDIALVARVNHAGAAQKVGMELRPTELLIFGNPKLGTPLMQSNQRAGIDLPLKALVWQDAKGDVWIGYDAPSTLVARHGIADRAEVVKKMTGALEGLAASAAKP
jgi:uncharacterized protein (DUF302 family)